MQYMDADFAVVKTCAGSEPGRKRKRKESTKGSQPNEDIKGPTKAAKKFKLGGRTARGSDEFDGPGEKWTPSCND